MGFHVFLSSREFALIVNVYGLPVQSVNTKSLLEEAAKFYAGILLEEDIMEKIELDIQIDFDMDCAGHCVTDDCEEYPKCFTISINPDYTVESMFDILAHEMVHLKQFATNELYNVLAMEADELTFGHIWKGERWYPNNNENVLFDSPWEHEAYGKQAGLYHRWSIRNET